MATTVPSFDSEQWVQRILRDTPRRWSGTAAKQPGGVVHALFGSVGNELVDLEENLQFAFNACRIATASDEALDLVAHDLFGDEIVRQPGEPDASLRVRILANLFLPAVTRDAFDIRITKLVGKHPRLIEPWSPADTGAWSRRGVSYWGLDDPQYPFRWANSSLRYQGFVESDLPPYSADQGNNPVYCWGKGMGWNIPRSRYVKANPVWLNRAKQLDSLINKIKAEGTTVWRRYGKQVLTRSMLGGTVQVPAESQERTVNVFPAFAGYYVVIAQPSWNTTVDVQVLDNGSFKLVFGVPAPLGATVDWVGAPTSWPGVGILPVPMDAEQQPFARPDGFATGKVFALPNWNTVVFLDSADSSHVVVDYSVPAPGGAALRYVFFDTPFAGEDIMEDGDLSHTIEVTPKAGHPFQAFFTPSWNTNIWTQKTSNSVTAFFDVPAPPGAKLDWAIHYS